MQRIDFMTSEELLYTYDALANLTGAMLVAAKARDWESLHDLEKECGSLATRISKEPVIPKLSGQALAVKVEKLQQILADDREIRMHLEPWMNRLQELMHPNSADIKLSQLRQKPH